MNNLNCRVLPRLTASLLLLGTSGLNQLAQAEAQETAPERPYNIVMIVSDDHRYDFMSCMPQAPKFLETPHLDRLAREGAHLRNAFVSTSLCSPSRASILTGQYMHRHRVVDNQRPVPPGTQFFPQWLQASGYQTSFVGKWHMGHENDEPRPGYDHWVSFKGQGTYFDPELNINGQRKEFDGYNADVLTNQAVDWIQRQRQPGRPFFLQVAYKAVHYPFQPARRHAGRYRDQPIDYPETMARTDRNYASQPRWVWDRRFSIHGIDHMETGSFDQDPVPDFDGLYHGYCEAVHSLDENIGRLLDCLDAQQLTERTVVLYLGDNGFHLGEHGFYDKRDAFETSIRVPMLVRAPGKIKPKTVIHQLVQNIDVAPTLLQIAGAAAPQDVPIDGRSFWPLVQGQPIAWRDHILYEYHWEWNFPATPSLLAIRTDRYKYVYYHGVWDIDSFHDLENDPLERHNLIRVPAYQEQIRALRDQMFREFEDHQGLVLPIRPARGERLDQRKKAP